MAKLIYTAITSLDGYIEDEHGSFDWSAPDEDVHAFVNDLERRIGTYLYGRRLYETMVYWETAPTDSPAGRAELRASLALGRQGRVLHDAAGDGQRPDPDRADLRPRRHPAMKEVGERGPQCRRRRAGRPRVHGRARRRGPAPVLNPVVVGAGKRALPDGVRLDLELLDERRFASGVVYLRYASR